MSDSSPPSKTDSAPSCRKVNISTGHGMLSHMGEAATRQTLNYLGYPITRGLLKPCESCRVGKAHQASLPKNAPSRPATVPNERIWLDISTIKKPKNNKKIKMVYQPYWRIMVDEYSGLKFSDFFSSKHGMIEPTCEKFNIWKIHNAPVQIVRCDNGGENIKLRN